MVKAESTKKNLIFQYLYQIVMLVLPLVTAPYVTRTLSKTDLGTYSYIESIVSYFSIFACLGISRHGQRIIATKKDDDIELRKTYWSLYTCHFITSIIAIVAYLGFASIWGGNDKTIYYIQCITLLGTLFDVTWFFYGIERFKSVLIKNFVFKIIYTILLFLLIKSPDDFWIYALMICLSNFLGQIWVFIQSIKLVKPIRFGTEDFLKHWKPLLILSISVIAVSLYTVFDKTLLGAMTTKENVALYNYSEKIISIPKTMIGVIGTVLFPKACRCFAKGDNGGMKKYFRISLLITYFIGIGAIFGLLGISDLFVNEYYGVDYAECGNLIKAMSILILVVGLGDIVRTQILIPMKKDVTYISILVANAVINIALSAVLIPVLGIYGAIIGTASAELFGLIAVMFVCRKYINFKQVVLLLIPFTIAGLAMWGGIMLINNYYSNSIKALIVQVLVGLIIYCIICGIYFLLIDKDKKEYRQRISNIFNKIKKKKHVEVSNSSNDNNM